jgi:hypothetical protein
MYGTAHPRVSPGRVARLRTAARTLRRAALAAIVLATGSAGVAYAAFAALTGNSGNTASSGTVAISDNDDGAALLSLTSARPGASATRCISVTYSGGLPATVRHYANVTGSLASSLTLKVTRGSGTSSFGSCSGFTADGTDYIGAGAGVIYSGKLSQYPSTYASGIVDAADTGSYASTVLAQTGLLSYWRLGEASGTTVYDGKGSNNGTYANGVSLGASGAIGDSTTAAQFDGIDDYVRVARQIQDDFSIEFWFKSTQGLNTGTNWWENAGLVDAEVAGAANDFGVSLRSDGRITAGVGTPDISIVSTSGGYNDGSWHHVVFTRKRSTGALALYVDAVAAGTATGSTQSLTSPANIDFGRLQAGWNYFAGALDDVALYTSVLSAADVAAHKAAGPRAAESWTTSETHDYKFQATLDATASEGATSTSQFRWEGRNQ